MTIPVPHPPRRLAVSLSGIMLAASAVPAGAATPAAPTSGPKAPTVAATSGPLWARSCAKRSDGKPVCWVEQFAIDPARKRVVMHVQIGYLGADGQPRIAVTTPLGVALQAGVGLSLDGDKPIVLPYQTCTPDGCLMLAVLQQDVLNRLLKAKAMKITFLNSANSPVGVPMRMDGLASAFASVQASQ